MKQIIKKYKKLNLESKSMIYLKWIFTIWNIFAITFINIHIYKIFNNIEYVIYYNLWLYTNVFIGFVFLGYIVWKLNINIKNLFYISYINLFISFIILFSITNNTIAVIVFTIFYWIGMWNYYCATNSYEIKEVKSKNRDFYSSVLSSWIKFLYIIIPLFISFIFFISEKLNIEDPYKILFAIIPFFYFTSLFFIKNLTSYNPIQINFKSLRKFLNFKKNKNILWYFLTDSITFTIPSIMISILLIYILKTEINLWIIQSFFSIISIIFIMIFSTKRNGKNRYKIMLYSGIIIFINFLILWFNISFFWLTLYLIIDNLIAPFYKISVWVYDMKYISKIKYSKNDFFPTLIFREAILWLWRISSLIIILLIIKHYPNDIKKVFWYSFLSLWFFYILSPLFVILEEKK